MGSIRKHTHVHSLDGVCEECWDDNMDSYAIGTRNDHVLCDFGCRGNIVISPTMSNICRGCYVYTSKILKKVIVPCIEEIIWEYVITSTAHAHRLIRLGKELLEVKYLTRYLSKLLKNGDPNKIKRYYTSQR